MTGHTNGSLTYGSLFSGIGGLDLGCDAAGMTPAFQCEIDKYATKILEKRWPTVPRFDDVRKVTSAQLADHRIVAPDVLVGGFPCQDISLAGARAGLAGNRSGLFYEFVRVASELTPRWLVIENVPGLLSSGGGRDMGAVIGTLGNLGYGVTYRVLDSQFFGLAQRRKRVFIVGHLGAPWSAPTEVLLEREGSPWDPAPGGGSREAATRRTRARLEGNSAAAGPELEVVKALTANMVGTCGPDVEAAQAGHIFVAEQTPTHEVSPCLQERGYKGADSDATQAYVVAKEPEPVWMANGQDIVTLEGLTGAITGSNGQPGNVTAKCDTVPLVRRLSPLECERLQGFDDEWTDVVSDTRRYKALGNAVSVPVSTWIARRLVAIDKRIQTNSCD